MRRTQLYVDDNIWQLLRLLARQSGTSVSDLVRRAIREKYCAAAPNRKEIFESVIGLWKDRKDLPETDAYVRNLRKGNRLERIMGDHDSG